MTETESTGQIAPVVEEFMTDWVSDNETPNAAVAVTDGDEVVYSGGFGVGGPEDDGSATGDTLFAFGSCAKPVTAAAVMQLVEAGEVALDDPVSDYVPHLEDAPGEPITLEELLTHTSGMVDDGVAVAIMAEELGVDDLPVDLETDEDFRDYVAGSTEGRVTERGWFAYYNTGYILLGKVIEEVTGQSYEEYVEKNIFAPLGMGRSTFDLDEFDAADDRMTPYLEGVDGLEETGLPFNGIEAPAGGLISSVEEMARIVRTLTGNGTVDGTPILSDESAAAMKIPSATFGTYFDGTDLEYGYGLTIEEFLDDQLIAHPGGAEVGGAWFGHLEEAELGVVLACSTRPIPPMVAGKALLALLSGGDPEEAVRVNRLMSRVQRAVGEYEGHEGVVTATVEPTGAGLQLTIDHRLSEAEFLLVPDEVEDDALICTTTSPMGLRQEVIFELGGDGATLIYDRFGLEKVA